MRRASVYTMLLTIIVIATVLLWAASPAGAAVFHVQNFGVDGSGCGSVASPCRSISQAIENASDNDRIIVGPGVYGDLNGSGTLADGPGEEFGGTCYSTAVCINKSLTVESSVGAGATLINTNTVNLVNGAVLINAPNAVFGGRERGFSIAPLPRSLGIYVFDGTGVEVTGNLVLAGSIKVNSGTKNTLIANVAIGPVGDGGPLLGLIYDVSGEQHRLTENVAIGTGAEIGFFVLGQQHRITRNSSSQNVFGFEAFVANSELTDNEADRNGTGFLVGNSGLGPPMVLRDNRARNNSFAGFFLNGVVPPDIFASFTLAGNVAAGNGGAGFQTSDHPLVQMRRNVSSNNRWGAHLDMGGNVDAQLNTFAGNLEAGVYTQTSNLNLTRNNIFGNGLGGQGKGSNCGLVNDSGAHVNALKNFWGAPTGPGPDPADQICNLGKSTTEFVPFASAPFPVP